MDRAGLKDVARRLIAQAGGTPLKPGSSETTAAEPEEGDEGESTVSEAEEEADRSAIEAALVGLKDWELARKLKATMTRHLQ